MPASRSLLPLRRLAPSLVTLTAVLASTLWAARLPPPPSPKMELLAPSQIAVPAPVSWRPATAGLGASSAKVVAEQAAYIRSAQTPDGALAWTPLQGAPPSGVRVSPYDANYGAIGLSFAYRVTGLRTDIDSAWRWLNWYGAHEQARTGYVSDWQLTGASPSSDGRQLPLAQQDSTDAYAATFVQAVWAAFSADADRAQLTRLWPAVTAALHALSTTTRADGLSFTQPGFDVVYLMDDAEDYAGLCDAAALASTLGDVAVVAEVSAAAAKLKAALASLWDPATGSFDWAVHSDGVRASTDWHDLYPDVMEQLWAVLDQVATPAQADAIIARLASAQPGWYLPTSLASFRDQPGYQKVGYWPAAAVSLAAAGHPDRAGVDQLAAAVSAAGAQWPFNVAGAGQLIVAEVVTPPAPPSLPAAAPPAGLP